MSVSDLAIDHARLILDGTKINWHTERLRMWERGERFAPISIDMALTRACQYRCAFCYAAQQENDRHTITKEVIFDFLDDCRDVGVKGISFVSDGESTLSPIFVPAIQRGHANGLSMAVGSNGYALDEKKIREILPCLTYFRFNISAGERERYESIMGSKPGSFERVCKNIETMVRVKKEMGLSCTIGLQMVVQPEYEDQILPLARLGQKLRPDYLVLKHCSDTEEGEIGVDYKGYRKIYDTLRAAEAMSDGEYDVHVKWSKIGDEGKRDYERCHGGAFLMQISGSGLVSSCGMNFAARYKKLHIGNICTERFKDMVFSDRYWEVMHYLASDDFNAKKMCGSACLQHKVNQYLDGVKKGKIEIKEPTGASPEHINFV